MSIYFSFSLVHGGMLPACTHHGALTELLPLGSTTKLKECRTLFLMNRKEESRSMGSWWFWKWRKPLENYPLCVAMTSQALKLPGEAPNWNTRLKLLSGPYLQRVWVRGLCFTPKCCDHVQSRECRFSNPDRKCSLEEPQRDLWWDQGPRGGGLGEIWPLLGRSHIH